MNQQSIGSYLPDEGDPQKPADAAVVIPTMIRPQLRRALQSIYAQDLKGRIQILLGVDRSAEPDETLNQMLADRPSNISAVVVRLPWSTAHKHGGVHTSPHGGALRSILSFIANSACVAYLDDDNEFTPDHLRKLATAMQGKAWAFSQRLIIDQESGKELGVDVFDSVGVDKGRYEKWGGFVDVSCLMIHKLRAVAVLPRWSEAMAVVREGKILAMGLSDRNVFNALRTLPYGEVQDATVRYYVRPTNVLHQLFREAAEAQAN